MSQKLLLVLVVFTGCGQNDVRQEYRDDDGAVVTPRDESGSTEQAGRSIDWVGFDNDDLAIGAMDAVMLLTDAQAEASRDGKNVLLLFSGPRCLPCKKMSLALASASEQIGKSFVVATVDRRMHRFDEVYSAYSRGVGSVPYISILSPSGIELGNSMVDGGNLGYPATESALSHFRKLIGASSCGLSIQEIDLIVSAFRAQNRNKTSG